MELSIDYEKAMSRIDMAKFYELTENYPPAYRDLLRLFIPVIADRFGPESEQILKEALPNIVIEEISEEKPTFRDISSSHEPENVVDIDDESFSKLDVAKGLHTAIPNLCVQNGAVALDGYTCFLGVNPLEYSYERISTFIHEVLHALKSTRNHFQIKTDDKGKQHLIQRCGIHYYLSELSILDDGRIGKRSENELNGEKRSNLAMEEGINTVDEFFVMNTLLSVPIDKIPKDLQYI